MEQQYEYPDTLAAAKSIAEEAREKADEKIDVNQFFLDYSKELPAPVSIIHDPRNKARIIVSEQNMFAIMGEAKSYKSFVASFLATEFFKQHPGEDCILIDTEQADWNVLHVAQRVCDGLGWEYEAAFKRGQLRIANLRKYSKKQRFAAVTAIVEQLHPKLCIIDGIRDLVTSVNDDTEASAVVDKFMEWTAVFNCAFGHILHTNKGTDDARGHLGFELLAKCETILLSKANQSGGATVKSLYSRNISIDCFDLEVDDKWVAHMVNKISTTGEDFETTSKKETAAYKAICEKVEKDCPKAEWLNIIRQSSTPMLAAKTAEVYFQDFVQFGILIPANKEETVFSHRDAPGVRPLTDQPDTQTSIPIDNSLGESNEDPF